MSCTDTIELQDVSPKRIAKISVQPLHHQHGEASNGEGSNQDLQDGQDQIGTNNPEQETVVYPSGAKLILTIIALALTIFLVALDSSIIAQAIPSITKQFGSVASITWYGTAYTLPNTSFGLVWGKAYKCFPLKRTYLLAIVIFEIGNIVTASADSSVVVVLGRIISGLGGAGLMNGSFIIMALTARPERRAMMMGITGVTFGCSSVVGPLLGGVLVDALNWRWCFWINLPFGAVAAGIIVVFFSQPDYVTTEQGTLKEKLTRLDINGGLLVVGSLTCFVFAMNLVGAATWNGAKIAGALIGSCVLAALFIGNEKLMGSKAMLQMHVLRNRNIMRNCAFAFFLAGAFFPLIYILPIQFQSIGQQSAAESGIRLIPLLLGVSIFTLISNGLVTYWKIYNAIFAFGAVFATAGAFLMYTYGLKSTTAAWIGSEVLASIGIGAALQLPVTANNAAVGIDDVPAATALALFFENVGTTLFVAATDGAFTKGLVHGVKTRLPTTNPETIINAGVTQLRSTFPPDELPAILAAYVEGCRDSHLIPVACAALAGLITIVSAAPVASTKIRNWMSKPHAR